METLTAFLQENAIKCDCVEYVASKRFVDDKGEPIRWKLRPLTNEEIEKLRKYHTKTTKNKMTQEVIEKFDNKAFTMDMTLKSVVYPDLMNGELQASWGVVDDEELLKAMLSPGELTDLHMAVNEACDFEVGMDEKIERAKN